MSKAPVLLFTNDFSSAFGKTTEYLAKVCENLGHPAIIHDSFDIRILAMLMDNLDETPDIHLRIEDEVRKYFTDLVNTYGIETVISLDLNWLLQQGLFTNHPKVKNIFSLWFDDIHTWTRSPLMKFLPIRKGSFQDIIKNFKVTHCFYGLSMSQEARILGVNNQRISMLAAPSEYLSLEHPCEITNKAAFIGNPGFRGTPGYYAIQKMNEGADLAELRQVSRKELLITIPKHVQTWISEEPSIHKLYELATQIKAENPFSPSLQIVQVAGESFPSALQYLNEKHYILEFAQMIKLVNRYDRPAFILRLYKEGLIDVFSNPEEWHPYGVESKPTLAFPELPRYYQKYAVHLNAANAVRDATANEKLFEISACGRMTINLDSPDVRACYSDNEICFVQNLDQLVEKTRYYLSHPDEALAMGQRTRQRTANEHTWEHRIKALLDL